ncbi:hypothetical protein [Thermoflavimicrobium daqui]|uniref:Uncharacterized protein n=1 Tax=Thermoflavimicrobium daqui TaxID=2137476 RepID=A0A364K5Y2_9BACL|nr:hypothetical protein [Thermoflavimicrobium daqui]RAL25693.1 hypothetical protein DL897_06355 [Thermoflavimicrobium daqui]
MNFQDVRDFMNSNESDQKIYELSNLADFLERGSIRDSDIIEIINFLIEKLIVEDNRDVCSHNKCIMV